jgi:CRISPR-associated protein Csx10
MTMYPFPYSITLQAPTIITAPGHRRFSASTLNYIPGSAIRGAVASRLGDPDGQGKPEQRRFAQFVTSGQVRYRNAYPVPKTKQAAAAQRSTPLPLSMLKRKHEPIDTGPELLDWLKQQDDETLVRAGYDFVILGTTEIRPVRVDLGARFHHSRDPAKFRPSKDEGSIFTYEHILPNQSFAGYLVVKATSLDEGKQIAQDIRSLLDDNLLLGRSRRAGYGGNADFVLETEPTSIKTAGKIYRDIKKGEAFRVLLLSDFIGRNLLTGLIDPDSFQSYLEKALRANIRLSNCYVGTGYAGGYNRKARSALPVTRTLRKGSVFVFEALEDIKQTKLLEIEASGLGMRLTEGYGELCFLNPPAMPVYKVVEPSEFAPPAQLPDKDEVSARILSIMQRRILAEELDREIHRWARELVRPENINISPSLIGRLRLVLRRDPKEALNTFRQWLEEKESEKTEGSLKAKARRQLQHCCLSGYSLFNWLQKIVEDDRDNLTFVLEQLNYNQLANDYCLVSSDNATAVLKDMAGEIRCKTIDIVLAQISREIRQRERGDKHD